MQNHQWKTKICRLLSVRLFGVRDLGDYWLCDDFGVWCLFEEVHLFGKYWGWVQDVLLFEGFDEPGRAGDSDYNVSKDLRDVVIWEENGGDWQFQVSLIKFSSMLKILKNGNKSVCVNVISWIRFKYYVYFNLCKKYFLKKYRHLDKPTITENTCKKMVWNVAL